MADTIKFLSIIALFIIVGKDDRVTQIIWHNVLQEDRKKNFFF